MKLLEENLSTPLFSGGDVVVIGAGSAGVAAALSAARLGAKTMLIDPAGFPGGNLTSGLPILGCHDGEKQVVKGILQELVDALREKGGIDGDPAEQTGLNIDAEKLKVILLEKLAEAGVDLRLHTLFSRAIVSDNKITSIVIEGKGGRQAVEALAFVDATGDADVAVAAGVPYEKGRKSDGLTQPMTMMFGVGGIDKIRFAAWGGYPALERLYAQVSEEKQFRNPRRASLAEIWGPESRTGEYTFNATRVLRADGTDGKSLTNAEIDGRLQVWEFIEQFLRPCIPGFESAYIVWTSAKIGVRESRRIVGEYVLTREDIWNFVKFPDVINCGSYPIDIHNPTGAGTEFPVDHFYGGQYWTIPYRSLVPLKVDNLWVAGRCLSATHEALSAVRCMANTIGMGQAAGTAAALALQTGTSNRTLDTRLLQKRLINDGAWLGELKAAEKNHNPILISTR
ncbi:MAG: FAD-dependent oxidoreductase [Chthoniobacterales bacterium]